MPLAVNTAFIDAQKIDNALVEELRSRFLKEYANAPNDFYEKDVENIKSSNWPLQRFLLYKKCNLNDALQALTTAMKWRKSFGVRELSDSDFPQEFYRCGGGFIYGRDLNGAQMIINRGKVNKKIKSWVPTLHRLTVYLIDRVDQNNDGKGLTILLDCKGAGMKNVDMDTIQFSLKVVREYYPGLLTVSLVHKLPVILEPVFKAVQAWLDDEDKKLLTLTKKKNLHEYVAKEQLPDFLLGTNQQSYHTVPSDAPTAAELAKKLGIKDEKVVKLIKHLEPFYDK